MNSSGDEDEDRFFETSDRIPSTSESEAEEECSEFGQKSGADGNGRVIIRPLDYSKYEIWKREPASVQERRERLRRELGLHNGGELLPDSNANSRRVQFAEIRPASAAVGVDGSVSGVECAGRGEESWWKDANPATVESDSNSADGRINFGGKENNLANSSGIGADEQRKSSSCLSSGDFTKVGEHRGGVISSVDNSSGELFVKIKNLDNGKEFVVNELGEDGLWNKLKEVDTGRQLSLEEFDRVVGHSPLVQELMRRENGEFSGRESPDLRSGGKGKKKPGWLRTTIKDVAQTMKAVNKDKKSSDEKDTSSEKGGRRSSSATDDSQEILLHMPKKTKVWHYGKSGKDFSELFMGQEIQAHQGSIWVLRFSLDGRYLASGGQDRIIHVWQSKQKPETPAEKSDDNVSNTYVTANGSTELMSLNIDSALDKKKKGLFLSGRKSSATSADCIFLPDSIFMLSEKPVCSFHGHLDDVLDLSWSQSQYLLSSSMDKTVRLWHMSYNICLRVFSHNDYVTCIQFNPIDDRFFISGSLDEKVRIWSILDRKVVDWTDIYEMVTAACYTPDGQGAFVGTHKGNCLIYNTSGNRLQEESQIEVQKKKKKKKSRGKKITGFQFVPGNYQKVLITSADSRIRIFDGAELVQTFKVIIMAGDKKGKKAKPSKVVSKEGITKAVAKLFEMTTSWRNKRDLEREINRHMGIGPSAIGPFGPTTNIARSSSTSSSPKDDRESVNQEPAFTTCKGTNDIEIKVDERGVVLKDKNGYFSYDTLRKCTFHEFDLTIDVEWRRQSAKGKQKVIDVLKKEFGEGWNPKWALKQMRDNVRWRRDRIRDKVKRLPKNSRKGGRPHDVDTKVWKNLIKKEEDNEVEKQSTTQPSRFEKAFHARYSTSSIGCTHKLGKPGKVGIEIRFGRFPSKEVKFALQNGFQALVLKITFETDEEGRPHQGDQEADQEGDHDD